METILKYFPQLTEKQKNQFAQLEGLYKEWNEKINVISRKDMESLYTHHVLHSLAIAKVITFKENTTILDIGTGGGFPGIPLAILFPECRFILIDSIGKKITVVKEVALALGLENVQAEKMRGEEMNVKVDFVVSRAVAPVKELIVWTRKLIKPGGQNILRNGWIFLKGGDLKEEINESGEETDVFELKSIFQDEYFETKKLLYISR